MTRRSVLTILAALLGIVATAAIAWSASLLAGQRIGLASEPFSVTSHLAPAPEPAEPKPQARVVGHGTRRPQLAAAAAPATSAAPAAAPATTVPPASGGQASSSAGPPSVASPAPAPASRSTTSSTVTSTHSAPSGQEDNGGGPGSGSGGSGGGRDD